MTSLITMNDIAEIKAFSFNTNFEKKVRPYIFDAQEFDVRPLIGDEFFIDILATPSNYPDLMDALTYTYAGHTYDHPGLKTVIALFSYARYKGESNTNETPFGVVSKTNEYSEPVSEQTLTRQMREVRSQAEAYWRRVEQYLDRFYTSYPLWRAGCYSGATPTGNGMRIRKVSRDNDRKWHSKRHR